MKTTYNFDPAAMRVRFHELVAERARLTDAEVGPLRQQLDDIIAKIRKLEAEMKPVDEAYRAKRQALVPIDLEMAVISRALKGQTAIEPAS